MRLLAVALAAAALPLCAAAPAALLESGEYIADDFTSPHCSPAAPISVTSVVDVFSLTEVVIEADAPMDMSALRVTAKADDWSAARATAMVQAAYTALGWAWENREPGAYRSRPAPPAPRPLTAAPRACVLSSALPQRTRRRRAAGSRPRRWGVPRGAW